MPSCNFPPDLQKRGTQMSIQQFVEDIPFSYEMNILKKSAKDWIISEMWVYHTQLLLTALTRKENYLPTTKIDSPPKTNVRISTSKNNTIKSLIYLPVSH
jgi:hypothetical protein